MNKFHLTLIVAIAMGSQYNTARPTSDQSSHVGATEVSRGDETVKLAPQTDALINTKSTSLVHWIKANPITWINGHPYKTTAAFFIAAVLLAGKAVNLIPQTDTLISTPVETTDVSLADKAVKPIPQTGALISTKDTSLVNWLKANPITWIKGHPYKTAAIIAAVLLAGGVGYVGWQGYLTSSNLNLAYDLAIKTIAALSTTATNVYNKIVPIVKSTAAKALYDKTVSIAIGAAVGAFTATALYNKTVSAISDQYRAASNKLVRIINPTMANKAEAMRNSWGYRLLGSWWDTNKEIEKYDNFSIFIMRNYFGQLV